MFMLKFLHDVHVGGRLRNSQCSYKNLSCNTFPSEDRFREGSSLYGIQSLTKEKKKEKYVLIKELY